MPLKLFVAISGMTADQCAGTVPWNATWTVTCTGPCQWRYILTAGERTNNKYHFFSLCNASASSYIDVTLLASGPNWFWDVQLHDANNISLTNHNSYRWQSSNAASWDCMNMAGYDVNASKTRFATGTTFAYHNSAATLTLTTAP